MGLRHPDEPPGRRAPNMQLRVVGDQPWDVSVDVLVVPLVGEPAFDGALAELDKRAGRLDNRAANDVTPEVLAGEARALAEQYGLSIDVLEPARAAELGMGML